MEPPAGTEAEPRMDASAPSDLRLTAFVLIACGALAIGVGSILTWVTAGFTKAGLTELTSVTKGIDTNEGKVALGCAAVALILVVVSRVVSDAARAVLAGMLVVVGALAAVAGAMFISSASTAYSPIDSESIVNALAAQLHQPPEAVRAALATVSSDLGPYTKVSAGPWVVIAGGLMVAAGGVLTVRWAARLSTDHAATDEDAVDEAEGYRETPQDGEPADDPMPGVPDAKDDGETSFD